MKALCLLPRYASTPPHSFISIDTLFKLVVCYVIRAQLVSQLIHVQLVLLV